MVIDGTYNSDLNCEYGSTRVGRAVVGKHLVGNIKSYAIGTESQPITDEDLHRRIIVKAVSHETEAALERRMFRDRREDGILTEIPEPKRFVRHEEEAHDLLECLSPSKKPADPPRALGGEVVLMPMDARDDDYPTAGKVRDYSGFGNHATKSSGATIGAPGKVGDAYNNPGPNARQLTIPNNPSLQITHDMSIMMWVRPADIAGGGRQNPWAKAYGGEGTITQEPGGSFNFYWGQAGLNSQPYIGFSSGGGHIADGQWTHIAVVRDVGANEIRWVINGNTVRTLNPPAGRMIAVASTSASYPVTIGDGYTNTYLGDIDDVRYLDRAVTNEEIQSIMEEPYCGGIVKRLMRRDEELTPIEDYLDRRFQRDEEDSTGLDDPAKPKRFVRAGGETRALDDELTRRLFRDEEEWQALNDAIHRRFQRDEEDSTQRSDALSRRHVRPDEEDHNIEDALSRRLQRDEQLEQAIGDELRRRFTRLRNEVLGLDQSPVGRRLMRQCLEVQSVPDDDQQRIFRIFQESHELADFLDRRIVRDEQEDSALIDGIFRRLFRTMTDDHEGLIDAISGRRFARPELEDHTLDDEDHYRLVRIMSENHGLVSDIHRRLMRMPPDVAQTLPADTLSRRIMRRMGEDHALIDGIRRRLIRLSLDTRGLAADLKRRLMRMDLEARNIIDPAEPLRYVRVIEESRNLSDAKALRLTRPEIDQLLLDDALKRRLARIVNDTRDILDDIERRFVRPPEEQHGVEDEDSRRLVRIMQETQSLLDDIDRRVTRREQAELNLLDDISRRFVRDEQHNHSLADDRRRRLVHSLDTETLSLIDALDRRVFRDETDEQTLDVEPVRRRLFRIGLDVNRLEDGDMFRIFNTITEDAPLDDDVDRRLVRFAEETGSMVDAGNRRLMRLDQVESHLIADGRKLRFTRPQTDLLTLVAELKRRLARGPQFFQDHSIADDDLRRIVRLMQETATVGNDEMKRRIARLAEETRTLANLDVARRLARAVELNHDVEDFLRRRFTSIDRSELALDDADFHRLVRIMQESSSLSDSLSRRFLRLPVVVQALGDGLSRRLSRLPDREVSSLVADFSRRLTRLMDEQHDSIDDDHRRLVRVIQEQHLLEDDVLRRVVHLEEGSKTLADEMLRRVTKREGSDHLLEDDVARRIARQCLQVSDLFDADIFRPIVVEQTFRKPLKDAAKRRLAHTDTSIHNAVVLAVTAKQFKFDRNLMDCSADLLSFLHNQWSNRTFGPMVQDLIDVVQCNVGPFSESDLTLFLGTSASLEYTMANWVSTLIGPTLNDLICSVNLTNPNL